MNSLILTKGIEKKKIIKNNNHRGAHYNNVKIPVNLEPKSGLNSTNIDLKVNIENTVQETDANNMGVNINLMNVTHTYKTHNNNDSNLFILSELQKNKNNNDNHSNILNQLHENVKMIYNVFQPIYKNNEPTTGFGDFIRGCYFLMEFCQLNKVFSYGFIISEHPIKYLLENFKDTCSLPNEISESVIKCNNTNFNPNIDNFNNIYSRPDMNIYNDFISFLKNCNIFSESIYIHTITYPNNTISENHKEIMRKLLQPTIELQKKVENAINNLQLRKYNYEIIHIRFGDDSIEKNVSNIDLNKFNSIIFYLNNLSKNTNYLLFSDNNYLKKLIVIKYPFIKTIFNPVYHTKNDNTDIECLKNTMMEFYLMSYSTNIMSFSVYQHGSGFSKWCAETYNVPYTSKFLE